MPTKGGKDMRLIPDPIRAEVKVQVQLPPEMQALLRDLHADRHSIGIASGILLFCTVAMTLKLLFGRSPGGTPS